MSTDNFSEIPLGLYIKRAYHESLSRHVMHISLKISDGPDFDQPRVPMYSEHGSRPFNEEFWVWAEANLPIWNYPTPIKSYA